MEWYSIGDELENFVEEGFYVHDFERDIDICDFDVNYFDECASEFSPADSKITSVVDYHRSAVETYPYDYEEFTSSIIFDRSRSTRWLKDQSHELRLFVKHICAKPRKFAVVSFDDSYLFRFLHNTCFCTRGRARDDSLQTFNHHSIDANLARSVLGFDSDELAEMRDTIAYDYKNLHWAAKKAKNIRKEKAAVRKASRKRAQKKKQQLSQSLEGRPCEFEAVHNGDMEEFYTAGSSCAVNLNKNLDLDQLPCLLVKTAPTPVEISLSMCSINDEVKGSVESLKGK